jgi:hypothetical protein
MGWVGDVPAPWEAGRIYPAGVQGGRRGWRSAYPAQGLPDFPNSAQGLLDALGPHGPVAMNDYVPKAGHPFPWDLRIRVPQFRRDLPGRLSQDDKIEQNLDPDGLFPTHFGEGPPFR